MSFLVYFFVLLVAAASVIFGLDWTQAPLNPPPYATLPAQTATVTPAPAPTAPPALAARRETTTASASADTAAPVQQQAAQAQARATDPIDAPATTASAAHCNIAACSASYRSFRASDCTYQPFGGERRVCTKTAGTGKVAAATRPHASAQRYDQRDERRLTDRRDYQNRGSWGFDFFGGNAYDDGR